MDTYKNWRPTAYDRGGAFLRERQAWLVVPTIHTRDSDTLEESNFATALALLGGESKTVEVHRFGHWGPGWCEIILVAHGSPQAEVAKNIERQLEQYPVLDDDDYGNREYEEYLETAESSVPTCYSTDFTPEERARIISAFGDQYGYDIDSVSKEALRSVAVALDFAVEIDGELYHHSDVAISHEPAWHVRENGAVTHIPASTAQTPAQARWLALASNMAEITGPSETTVTRLWVRRDGCPEYPQEEE